MARRPEEPKRNRRSAGPLDWLAEEQTTPAGDDESPPPGAWAPPRRPSPYAAAPVDETPPPRRPGAAMPSRRELRKQAAERDAPPRGFTEPTGLRPATPPDPPAAPAGPAAPVRPPLRNRELPPTPPPLPHERPWVAAQPPYPAPQPYAAPQQYPAPQPAPTGQDNPWQDTPPDSRGRAWGEPEAPPAPQGRARTRGDAPAQGAPTPAVDPWSPERAWGEPEATPAPQGRERAWSEPEATPAPHSRERAWGEPEATPAPRSRERARGEGGAESEPTPSPRPRGRERARGGQDAGGAPAPSAEDMQVSGSRAEAPTRRRDARRTDDEGGAEERRPTPTPRRRRVATYLTLAALLLALWSASCFFDAGPLAGLTSVAPLVSILAIPVIAVGVGSKHPVPTAIAAVAALVPWTLVPGYAATGPGRVDVGNDNTLRVMSVNAAAGHADPGNIVSLVRSYQVDVVVVTELTSELAHDLTVAGLGTLAASRWVSIPAGGSDGTGVWSRLPVRDLKSLPGLSGASVQGNLVTGRDVVRFTAVQLGGEALRPGRGWRGDLHELATPPSATRAMIVGDLNASPWQPAFRRVTGAGWRDAADVVGQGLRPTWPSWSAVPIAPLDHVLVSKGLGVNAADTANVGGTDHRALIVTLVVPGGGD